MKRIVFLSIMLAAVLATPAFCEPKNVSVIGTIHGDHNRYPFNNFETLRIVIEHISPDLLLIEEDPKTFAQKWYEKMSEEEYGQKRPIEIRKVVMPYALKYKVRVIPVDDRAEYDKYSEAHKSDKKTADEKKALYPLIKAYESLFLDDYLKRTIFDFQSDTFMAVIDQYLEQARLDPVMKEGEAVSDQRQTKIDQNIVAALKKEKFRHAVIVYGVSHRPAIVRAIMKSGAAKLVPLEQAMKPKIPSFFERDTPLILK